MMSLNEIFRTKIIPFLVLISLTVAVQLFTLTGRNEPITFGAVSKHWLGNTRAWGILFAYILWCYIFLKIPSRKVFGPAYPSGFKPHFHANGILFFWSTLAAFGALFSARPDWALDIYANVPELFGAINVLGFLFCLWLLIKGKFFPEQAPEDAAKTKDPIFFEFYRGVELYPTLFGVSVKQLVICRFGVMGWMLLALIHFIASIQLHGFSYPFFVSIFLQLVYTLKTFLYESRGYLDTIDNQYDRAGYYLIWGSMVWMPGFYSLHTYYFVANPPETSPFLSMFYLILGLVCIVVVYRIDVDKFLVRSSKTTPVMLYGKPAEIILADYTDDSGNKRTSKLLASGFWGISRHLNYVAEILLYICFTAPGYSLGLIPFLLPLFLVVFFLHRLSRDEDKSSKKYGKYWELYCSKVPYKLIPWIY